MASDKDRALFYLKRGQLERQIAWNEHLYGRPYQINLTIAKEYEELAKKIIGDEAVTKYILDHSGEIINQDGKIVKVYSPK